MAKSRQGQKVSRPDSKRRKEEKLTDQDIFGGLLGTVYNLSAEDRLRISFGPLGETGLFKEYFAQVPGIRTSEDFEKFAGSLPGAEEMAHIIKDEIIKEYGKLEDEINRVEAKRQEALEHPQIDVSDYVPEFARELLGRFKIKLGQDDLLTKDDFETLRPHLEGMITRMIKQRIKTRYAGGIRIGDTVEAVRMSGFDMDELMEPMYSYGGDEHDIPLGSKGEIISIDGSRNTILFDIGGKEVEWELHPTEMEGRGQNRYVSMVKKEGSAEAAAKVLIEKVEERLVPKYLQRAADLINARFDAEIISIASALKKRFDLGENQIISIINGEDFEYPVISSGRSEHNLGWDNLGSLAKIAMSAKKGRQIYYTPEGIKTEEGFRRSLIQAAKEIDPKGYAKLVKETCEEMAPLLIKQHYLKERELRVRGDTQDSLQQVMENLISRDVWFRRLLMYNQKDLYLAGDPFAPPSEELERVLKLESGDGCNYGKCTFCAEYAGADYFVKSPEEFARHAAEVKKRLGNDLRHVQRVFLSGANIFSRPPKILLRYLETVDRLFNRPERGMGRRDFIDRERGNIETYIRRVEAFSRTEGILTKSVDELKELFANNLKMIYWGAECGSDEILRYVNKGITREQMDQAIEKINQTDFMISIMIMPGLGGMRFYEEFVVSTRDFLNKLKPRYITFHTTTPKPGTRYVEIMKQEVDAGTNRPLTDEEVVEQMYDVVSGLDEGYRSLVATYYPPAAKIAINPIMFRGYLDNIRSATDYRPGDDSRNGKAQILYELTKYFREGGHVPSIAVPIGQFNKGSAIRDIAAITFAGRVIDTGKKKVRQGDEDGESRRLAV